MSIKNFIRRIFQIDVQKAGAGSVASDGDMEGFSVLKASKYTPEPMAYAISDDGSEAERWVKEDCWPQ